MFFNRIRARIACLMLVLALLCLQLPAAFAQSGESPLLEDQALRTTESVLYYLNEDGTQLIPLVRRLTLLPAETLAQALLSALAKEEEGLLSPYPRESQLYVRAVEQAGSIVTVDFGGDFSMLPPRTLFNLKAAVVNTLTAADDIQYVNLLFNGMELTANEQGSSFPSGTLVRFEQDLSSAWAKEQEAFRPQGSFTRNVTLYFLSADGRYLLPEVRPITFTSDDYITPILDELVRGPKNNQLLRRSLPASLTLLGEPYYDFLSNGGRYVHINLNYAMGSFLSQESGLRQQILGSLVCTLTTFVPNLSGVHIRLNRRYMDQEDTAYRQERVYIRSQFEYLMASTLSLYLPRADGRLLCVSRNVPCSESTLRDLLEELLSGPGEEEDADVLSPFPEGFTSACVKSLCVVSDTLLFNLSEEGASRLSSLTPEQENSFVYSIVNTYTALPGIRRVQFLKEGFTLRSLAGRIDLRDPLMRNPALIQQTLN